MNRKELSCVRVCVCVDGERKQRTSGTKLRWSAMELFRNLFNLLGTQELYSIVLGI